jgi:hypothetical protein
MYETEEKTLNSLVPLGLIHAFQAWFHGFQVQWVEDPRPCLNCRQDASTDWAEPPRFGRSEVGEERQPSSAITLFPE